MEFSTVLEVKDLSINVKKQSLLENSSFYVKNGEVVLIQGPNGSGKTSILKAIIGDFSHFSIGGESDVFYCDQSLRELEDIKMFRKQIAYVEQLDNNYTARTPYEYVLQSLVLAKNKKGNRFSFKNRKVQNKINLQDKEKVESLFKVFKKDEIMDQKISSLSGGELRITSLVAAFIRDVRLYILDEPINKLDYATAKIVGKYITSLSKKGAGVLIITHCRMFLKADRAYEIRDKSILQLENVPKQCGI